MVAASGRDERTFEAYLEPVEQSLRREGFDTHPGTPERYRADSYHRRQFEAFRGLTHLSGDSTAVKSHARAYQFLCR
jgi:hypothetical protein